MEFHKSNHYIPQFYIKNWSRDGHKVKIFRFLVSHENVPKFEKKSISKLGFYDDLYTDYVDGEESDYLERWIDKNYETPAKEVIDSIRKGKKITNDQYKIISEYMVCQHLRTPAYFKRNVSKWRTMLEEIIKEIKIPTKEEIQALNDNFINKPNVEADCEEMNVKVKVNKSINTENSNIEIEAHVGRKLWIDTIKRHLKHTINIFPKYKWTILQAPDNFYWPTSDNPVAVVNYYSHEEYDFTGGWGFEGSEIFMPISPSHVLYTQVGSKEPSYKTATYEKASIIKKLIIENADEFVISLSDDEEIEKYRERVISHELFNQQKKEWKEWLRMQSEIDREYQK